MATNDHCDDSDSRLPDRVRPWLKVLKLTLGIVAAALGILRSAGLL